MKPSVSITLQAWQDIQKYITVSALEISMLGEVNIQDGRFLINKIHLPQQTREAAFTKITQEGVEQILLNPEIDPAKVKCWIHSHVYMGVTPSAVDKKQAEDLMQDAEWFIRMIVNKRWEYSCFIHWMGIDIECDIDIQYNNDIDRVAVQAEIDAVTVKTVYSFPTSKKDKKWKTGSPYPYKSYHGYYDNDDNNYNYSNKELYMGGKIRYAEHVAKNSYLTMEAHNDYILISNAVDYGVFSNIIRNSLGHNAFNKLDEIYLANLYEDYLSYVFTSYTSSQAINALVKIEKDEKDKTSNKQLEILENAK